MADTSGLNPPSRLFLNQSPTVQRGECPCRMGKGFDVVFQRQQPEILLGSPVYWTVLNLLFTLSTKLLARLGV